MINVLFIISCQGAILAGIVFCITFFAGNRISANVRFLLWGVVMLRFLLPISVQSSASLFSVYAPEIKHEQRVATQTPIAQMPQQAVFTETPIANNANVDFPRHHEITQRETAPFWPKITLVDAAIFCWILGVICFLLRMVSSEIQLANRRKNWTEIKTGPLWNLLQECQKELGLRRRIRLCLSPEKLGAASCGLFWPTVVLSKEIEKKFSLVELRLIVLHELMHHKRLDTVTNLLGRLVVAVHWPNPFAHLVSCRMRTERELAVDESILKRTGLEFAHDYSDVILKTVRQYALVLPTPNLLGVQSLDQLLERRITMILKLRKSTLMKYALGITLVATLAITGLTNARIVSSDDTPLLPEPATTEERAIESQVDDTPIEIRLKLQLPDGCSPEGVEITARVLPESLPPKDEIRFSRSWGLTLDKDGLSETFPQKKIPWDYLPRPGDKVMFMGADRENYRWILEPRVYIVGNEPEQTLQWDAKKATPVEIRLVDEKTGKPIVGISAIYGMMNHTNAVFRQTSTSDMNGVIRFPATAEKTRIKFNTPFDSIPCPYPDTEIAITSEDTKRIELKLPAPVTFRIVRPDGTPADGVNVSFQYTTDDGTPKGNHFNYVKESLTFPCCPGNCTIKATYQRNDERIMEEAVYELKEPLNSGEEIVLHLKPVE